jgi:hypothetical protein
LPNDVTLRGGALLLFPREFDGALPCAPFILGQPSGGGRRCRRLVHGDRRRRRSRFDGRCAAFGHAERDRRGVRASALGLDDHRLRPAMAEALLHDPRTDGAANAAWFQGQRGATTGNWGLPIAIVVVRHALA